MQKLLALILLSALFFSLNIESEKCNQNQILAKKKKCCNCGKGKYSEVII
jgi:hypothetical protein